MPRIVRRAAVSSADGAADVRGQPVRRFPFRRGFGFGHLFGLIFLVRHPILFVVIVVVLLGIYLYRRSRR